jgi:hypothetical protein
MSDSTLEPEGRLDLFETEAARSLLDQLLHLEKSQDSITP